jgi:two-component system sensor histidine kinase/response regulator
LMDSQMPEMDGYSAAGVIRETERGTGRRIPIVALTAHAFNGERERCLAAGMDDYIAKPVQTPALIAALSRWLGSEPRAGAPDEVAAEPTAPQATAAETVHAVLRDAGLTQAEIQEVLTDFLESTPPLVDRLGAAVREGDPTAASGAAHSVRGALSSVGLTDLAARLLSIEKQIAAGDMAGAEAIVVELSALLRALRENRGGTFRKAYSQM